MVRLIVIGATGRMGRRVIALSAERDDVEVVGAVIRPDDPRVGEGAGQVIGEGARGVPLAGELPDVAADAAIDLSAPEGTRRILTQCVERGLPLVIATTGLDAEAHARIEAAARSIPVLVAPNLSVGVALLRRLAGEAARALGLEADIEITEAHHRRKKDAPSGTALELARAVAAARGQELDEVAVYGRRGVADGDRSAGEIAVHALRMGDVVGEHTVALGFGSERIELTHRAHSRDVFARGGLRAAAFIARAEPGLYTVRDMLARGA